MTKEELIDRIFYTHNYTVGREDFEEIIKEFLDSNVCIHKGTNRHPYADVLHEWIEDISKVLQYDSYLNGQPNKWETSAFMRADNSVKLRIKPQESVYEWQWLCQEGDSYVVSDQGRFLTYNESCDGMLPIEETKRERK